MARKFLVWTFTLVCLASAQASARICSGDDCGKVGVLFGSYGDVDKPSEVRELVTNISTDPDIVPVPWWVRWIIRLFGWEWTRDEILAEYKAIGNATYYRANSQMQADLVADLLRDEGYDAAGYIGFSGTFPYVDEAMDLVRADGVDTLVVFHQGAQYSHVTSFIIFREVLRYLDAHPDWDISVVGVRSFSDDARFQRLVIDNTKRARRALFGGVDNQDLCVFLPVHGNNMHWIERGDPSYDQMLRVIWRVQDEFPDNHVTYGFQNHDFAFSEWTQPSDDAAIDALGQQPCTHVLMNGQISFTIDSLETLYDQAIAARRRLDALGKQTGMVDMFNDDIELAELLRELTTEALSGYGDLQILR